MTVTMTEDTKNLPRGVTRNAIEMYRRHLRGECIDKCAFCEIEADDALASIEGFGQDRIASDSP